MTAVERNYLWVGNHAIEIASRKRGWAYGCFTVGEVVEALGFSRNTCQKYVDIMAGMKVIERIEIAPMIVFYRFTRVSVTRYETTEEALKTWWDLSEVEVSK